MGTYATPDDQFVDPIVVMTTLLANPDKITNLTAAVTVDAAPRPDYLKSLFLPGYGTKITRIAGNTGDTTAIGGKWASISRHHYSKNQPWNHDMTMICIEQKNTSDTRSEPTRLILDGKSYLPIMANKFSSNNNPFLSASEFRWRPQYATQAITWNESGQILKLFDIVTRQSLWNDAGAVGVHIPSNCVASNSSNGRGFGLLSEGVLSDNGRYLVLCTNYLKPQQAPGKVDYFRVVDLEAKVVGPPNYFAMPYKTKDYGDIDFCSISPLGNYVIIKYSANKVPEYARCFTINPTTLVATPRVFVSGDNPILSGDNDGAIADPRSAVDYNGWMACMSHGDFQISADPALTGTSVEVYVGGLRIYGSDISNCSSADKAALGRYIAQSMDKGKHVHISVGTTGLSGATETEDQHSSGRCYMAPGWMCATYTYHATNKLSNEIVLWPVLANGAGIRCGTTRSDESIDYNAEAHAVPSPGCEKIMFASNWQRNITGTAGPGTDIKSYVLAPTGPVGVSIDPIRITPVYSVTGPTPYTNAEQS